MASALPRPRQASIAGWVIIAGSAAVVLTVFQQIAGLNSLDTREGIERALSDPPFDEIGMSPDDVLGVIRVLSMAAAACATAAAILGWYALQRSRAARIALSILALPLFITGLGTGAVLSTAVALAVVTLWLRPARDWFDGTWKPEPERPAPAARRSERRPERPGQPGQPEQPAAAWPPPTQQPPPYAGWPPPRDAAPTPGGWPPSPPTGLAPAARVAPAAGGRPPAVLAAVVLTWVCSVLLGTLFVAGAAWLIASPDTLMDQMTRQNPELMREGDVTVGLLRAMMAVMAGLVIVWVLAACVLAFLVLRRKAWARVLLLASTGVAGAGLLIGTVVNLAMAVPLVAASAVFALLLRGDVTAWFSRR